MARPFQITGGARASLVAALLLTTLPLAAQEQPAQPPLVGGVEAPALSGGAAAPETEATPTLPGAESSAPVIPGAGVATEEAPAATETTAATGTDTDASGVAADSATTEAGTTGAELAPGPEAGMPDHRRPGGHRPGPEAGGPPEAGPGTLPHDLSPWGMFMAADIVVKVVMISLAIAAFVTLTILVYKSFELALAKRSLRRAQRVIRASGSLPSAAGNLSGRRDPAAFMAQAALDELQKSTPALDVAGTDGVKERTRSIIERTEAQAGRRLARGTGLLASIGSVSPFVGLFGTVWGILNAFIGISKSQTTNLAVVAPGIAEALLATAIGLVAAIPAVIVYNHFSRQIQGYRQALGDAGAGVERLLSRDLDFRRLPAAAE